jgi:hypothetical protein
MRRFVWIMGLLALPLAACDSDAINNSKSLAYLIDGPAQIPETRRLAQTECLRFNREAGLYNVTQFQHLLVVFDCRPPGEVRFDIKTGPAETGQAAPAS